MVSSNDTNNPDYNYDYNPSLQLDSNINPESIRISGSVSTDSGTSVSGNVYGSSVSGKDYGSSLSDNIYGLNITTSVPRSQNKLQKILSSIDKQVNACNISSIVNSSGLNSSSVSGNGSGSESGNRPYTEIQTTPLLSTGQIYIGNNGRTTISIIDSKTFHLYNLHVSKDVFISNNGIDFVVTNNPSITASVVTSGPEGCLGQQINGQAIRLSFGGKYYYFYKSDYPALLIRGDEFLATNGQTYIDVISQNEINLMNVNPNENNNNQLVRTYSSTNGVKFIDKKNSKNIATIIIDGPNSQSLGKKIYGQGIKIYNEIDTKEITYFYYNGNKLTEIQNDISTADITENEDIRQMQNNTTQAPIVTTQAPIVTTQAPIVTTQAPKVPGLAWKSFNGPLPFDYNNSAAPHLYYSLNQSNKNHTKYHTFQNNPFFTSDNTKTSTVGTTVREILYDGNIADVNNANLFGFKNNQYGENISLIFKGYFKPDTTGTWKFLFGNSSGQPNDDISVFWIDDKNNTNETTTHWPPSDTNWNFKCVFNSSEWIYETSSLTAGTYYPIQISWGQSWGGSLFKFNFLGPNGGPWRTNGDGFFFSDTDPGFTTNPPVTKLPGLAWESYTSNLEKIKTSDNGTLIKNIKYFNITTDAIFGTPRDRFRIFVKGYFKPNQTGTWSFVLGIPNEKRNDDNSQFWIDDDKANRWPPNDNNYVLNPSHSTGDYEYSTQLTSGKYYPIEIHFQQHTSTMIFNFYFKGPGIDWTTDGSEFFFSDPKYEGFKSRIQSSNSRSENNGCILS